MNLSQAAQQALAFCERITHWQEGTPDLHTVKTDLRQALGARPRNLLQVYEHFTKDQWQQLIEAVVRHPFLTDTEKAELLAKMPSGLMDAVFSESPFAPEGQRFTLAGRALSEEQRRQRQQQRDRSADVLNDFATRTAAGEDLLAPQEPWRAPNSWLHPSVLEVVGDGSPDSIPAPAFDSNQGGNFAGAGASASFEVESDTSPREEDSSTAAMPAESTSDSSDTDD